MNDSDEVRRLNRATFEAEQRREQEPLEAILADEFRIKRASGTVQSKKEMIYDVLFGPNPFLERRVAEDDGPDNPKIFANCAVITSLLTTQEQGNDGALLQKTFRNVKIFMKQEDRWRCVSWQVFRES
ncbi:MAG TPA: hypothetical protein DCL15_19710 [Chloroflexi bacterium]|nr:hypothetical protein [Chloroflexota bacterium]HHW86166.1 nuclear transport factor 2 family protein [Chloroflexota bacterium]